jgi:hypothetical protein
MSFITPQATWQTTSIPFRVVIKADPGITSIRISDGKGDVCTTSVRNSDQNFECVYDISKAATGPITLTVLGTTASGQTITQTVTFQNTAAPPPPPPPPPPGPPKVSYATGTMSWDQPDMTNVAGFRLKCGTASGQYTMTGDVKDPNARSAKISDLLPSGTSGILFCVMVSFDATNAESGPSNEVSFTLVAVVPPTGIIIPPDTTPPPANGQCCLISVAFPAQWTEWLWNDIWIMVQATPDITQADVQLDGKPFGKAVYWAKTGFLTAYGNPGLLNQLGPHTFTVSAVGKDGKTQTTSVTFQEKAAPPSTPVDKVWMDACDESKPRSYVNQGPCPITTQVLK